MGSQLNSVESDFVINATGTDNDLVVQQDGVEKARLSDNLILLDDASSPFSVSGEMLKKLLPTAWVAFTKGVGIDDQYNVASVVSSGATHTVTFTTPMDNANYAVSSSVDYTIPSDVRFQCWVRNKTVNGFELLFGANLGDTVNFVNMSATVHGGRA